MLTAALPSPFLPSPFLPSSSPLLPTPSYLNEKQDPTLAEDIKHLHFLVLDEADRMIETGHFKELDGLLRLTRREFQ